MKQPPCRIREITLSLRASGKNATVAPGTDNIADDARVGGDRGRGVETSQGESFDHAGFFAGDGGVEGVDPGYASRSEARTGGGEVVPIGVEEVGEAGEAVEGVGDYVVWVGGEAGLEVGDVGLVDWD